MIDRFSPREREIARLIARSHTNRQIAAALGTREQTVKGQVSTMLRKANVRNRTGLALYVIRGGLN